jgi:Endonuclease-reverse transcriptase
LYSLLQEPWFDTIGTARKDEARQGVDVLGGVASPGWEILYPSISKDQRPKVMAYARKWAPNSQLEPPFTVVPWLDVSAYPCVQVLDIVFNTTTWHIINFYHNVRDALSLEVLINLDIDELTPTLVVGDFNTHANAWSLSDVPHSRWVDWVEGWAARNLLALANNPGEITHRGADHECDSVIDLAWYNTKAVQTSTFYDLRVDWEGSLGSNHACLRIAGLTQSAAHPPREEGSTGYVVDPERKEEWINHFKASPPPLLLPSIPTVEEVEQAAVELFENIQVANENTFRRRRPFHPKAAPWWNDKCAAATRTL